MKHINTNKFARILTTTSLCLTASLLYADDKTAGRDSSQATDAAHERTEKSGKKSDAKHDKDTTTAHHFLMEAAQGGMMEVKMGQLAVEKGQSPAVKEFGRRLVADHTKANEELKQIAQTKGVELPKASSKKHDKMIDHLSGLSGAEFDKAFVMHAVKDHQNDVKQFEKQSMKGDDTELKAFATKTLPTLREHLRMAKALPGADRAETEVNEAAGAEATKPHGDKANRSLLESEHVKPNPQNKD